MYDIRNLTFILGAFQMMVSPTKAIKMYNVSKPTLYSDMKTGKLSYDINDRKKRKINIAELERVYEKRKTEEGDSTSESVKQKLNLTESNTNHTELENIRKSLADSQQRENDLLRQQIDQLQNQVEALNKNLNKALDITALLEDKREGQGAKEKQRDAKLEILERQLAKMEDQNKILLSKEHERKKKIEEKRKLDEAENNKGWVKRLFG